MTGLRIADCRLEIHGVTIGRLPIGGLLIGATPAAAGCGAVMRSNRQSNRLSAIFNPPIGNLQSTIGNEVWAS